MTTKRIEPGRSGTRAVYCAARHFARKARQGLAAADLPDAAVHAARKALQRSRAALRLLRPALGERRYRGEDARLRAAAHALNPARDANVLVQALDSLRRADPAVARDAAAARLSHRLHARRRTAQRQLRDARSLAALRRALRQLGRRTSRWRAGKHGWSVLGPAFEHVYRVGRRRLRAVRDAADDPALHGWRKQVKYLRHALQMLQPMHPRALDSMVRQAHRLSEQLGEVHDLSLLAQQARSLGGREGQGGHDGRDQREGRDSREGESAATLLADLERRRARLATRALASGRRLYRSRPRALTRRLGGYWRAWRDR
ncbi:MAG TPA: CHAD domain-containing protein [Steroidobacteraceae bacterium]|nr:CHAD domain-containing protein [Steroidobacteraceae bacterium]